MYPGATHYQELEDPEKYRIECRIPSYQLEEKDSLTYYFEDFAEDSFKKDLIEKINEKPNSQLGGLNDQRGMNNPESIDIVPGSNEGLPQTEVAKTREQELDELGMTDFDV